MDIFSERLLYLRDKVKKLTQTELGEAVNLSRFTISNLENGRTPDGETLVALAQYFDVSTDYLLGLSPDLKPQGDQLTEGIHRLAALCARFGFQPLTSAQLDSILAAAEYYLSHGASVGEQPLKLLAQLLAAYTDLLLALSNQSLADVMVKGNQLSATLLDISKTQQEYMAYKQQQLTPNNT